MLKVVGASWVQTRITLFVLIGVTVVGLITYYYGGNTTLTQDGKYAATVYWSKTAGYRIYFWGQNNDPATVRKGVARAFYVPDMTTDGWASIEIETSPDYPDSVQAHAAGLLEGSLSWQLIYFHWKNTVESACEDRAEFCQQARIILDQNTVNVREKAKALDLVDPFWHQVNLFYEQLDGLEVGWQYAVDRSRKSVAIPHQDFLWMNMACDLQDLEQMYNASLEADPDRPPLSMALLKLLPNNSSQFLLAHASSTFYSAMLRVQKRYAFGLHLTGASDAAVAPGQAITFTSYPGAVHSQDDFYRMSSGLTVAGTAIKNHNQTLWASAPLTEQVMMGPRVMAANRLARNGQEWSQYVAQSYSGSGNKQWLVVQPIEFVTLWVVEQIPGVTVATDQTVMLNETGYWSGYGLPYYQEIAELSGSSNKIYQTSQQVAKVLSLGQSNVTDLESLVCLMRSPDLTLVARSDLSMDDIRTLQLEYQHRFLHPTTDQSDSDELSNEIMHGIQEEPENLKMPPMQPRHFSHNVKEVFNTIIAMKRLNEELKLMEKGDYKESDESSQGQSEEQEDMPEIDLIINKRKVINYNELLSLREFSGVIDLKVSQNDGYRAAAGPPFSLVNGSVLVQPFQWSKSVIKDLPHVGQADVWNFDPVEPSWVWN